MARPGDRIYRSPIAPCTGKPRPAGGQWARPIHAIGLYSTEAAAIEALSLTGFGRIMADAARPAKELAMALAGEPGPAIEMLRVRRAGAADV